MTTLAGGRGRRRVAARLLYALALMWAFALASPCVMAATGVEDPCPMGEGTVPDRVEHCGLAALDCELPQPNIPFAIAPAVPAYTAYSFLLLPVAGPPALPRAWLTAHRAGAHSPSHPPPYLEFANLLI